MISIVASGILIAVLIVSAALYGWFLVESKKIDEEQ